MAINFTGVDEEQYFLSSTILNVSLFTVLVLPPLTLCLLCVVALAFVAFNNRKIRKITILLLNIFAVEITSWVCYSVFYLGFPARVAKLPGDYSCHVFFILFGVVGTQRFMSTALYSIMVYISIKHGEKKMKWRVILPCIFGSWVVAVVSIVTSLYAYTSEVYLTNSNGFCRIEQGRISTAIATVIYLLLPGLCLAVTITFCILTFFYIKKNTLHDNATIKKATAKFMWYFSIILTLSFIGTMAPAAFEPVRARFSESDVIVQIAMDHAVRVFFLIPPFTTPIVAIVLLKPVRAAFLKVYCACWRGGAADQALQQPDNRISGGPGRRLGEPKNREDSERKGPQHREVSMEMTSFV